MESGCLRWSPDVVWREERSNATEARRRLEAGETPERLGVITLSAEDQVSQLNLVGAEIWRRCDGTRDLEALVRELQGLFQADPERVAADVRAFVGDLLARGWLVREP